MAFCEPFSKLESRFDHISTTDTRRNNGDGYFRSCLICCGFVEHTIDLRQRMNILAVQDIRIVYRDIGMMDSNMEKGEQPVQMATLPQSIDEVVKMLA